MTVDQSCDSIVPSRHVISTNSWKLPDTPSDLIVKVGCISYALHKAALVSKSGLFKMLVAEGTKEEASKVDLDGIPGGAEGFDLAAKFCYGMMPEMTKHNVALLRCVAEFLDMSEDKDEVPNLISVTEDYLDRVMAKHLFKDIVTVLHTSESLLPLAEDVGIVSQCVECIVAMVMHNDRRHHVEEGHTLITFQEFQHNMNNKIDWWVEDLSMLGINFYQKVLSSMKKAGLKPEAIGHALIYYAHKSLRNLTKKSSSLGPLDHGSIKSKVMAHDASMAVEHEQRILVETIVSLLPREKNIATINFLIGMLRIAHILETTLACRLDLEKRIASQLHKATLDDLLMPSHSKNSGGSLFDVDTVHHLVASFIEQQRDHDEYDDDDDDDTSGDGLDDKGDGFNTSMASQSSPLIKVGKLVDGYLAEIAADSNLPLSKFISLAELLPAHARPQSDGLYRAIDIFMKTHTGMTDVERKKICRMIDFQKLTAEACTHAAQNERLPVQAVVQVLYFEQMRIRNVMAGSHFPHVDELPSPQGHHHPRHSPHVHSPHGHHIPSLHSPDSAPLSDGHHHNAPFADGHRNGSHRTNPFGVPFPHAHHPYGHHQDSPQEAAPAFVHKISNGNLCAALSPHDQYASVRIENRELKQEVVRMKMRLNDLEKGHFQMKHEVPDGKEQQQQHHHHSQNHNGLQEEHKTHHYNTPPPQQHHGGFFHAFSKSLSKLNPFHHHKLAPAPTPPPPQLSASKRRSRSTSTNQEQVKGRESTRPARRHSSST
ncbi:hypothetical protein GOP47_0007518 [Adiantum capillus-veneris]|uniref:Uncharacterized protein n=1 Tax=Adiantum capillus-veneris TaxID=13818 RepID=A0A9D4ZJD6_ADICA|nr:hypothetical protein GOP47_0007518 [Adiantum capillus-veneris]